MSSFSSYDWDNDQKWKTYLNNTTIPSGNESQLIDKLKKKYYKREIDPDFEENATTQSPPASQRTASPPPTRNTSAPPPPSTQSTNPAQGGAGLISLQKVWFVAHVYLIVNFILYLVSAFTGDSGVSPYWRALWSGIVAYGSVLVQLFGAGAFTGGNVRAKDNVYYMLYCAGFLTVQPSLFPLIPLVFYSFFQIADSLSRAVSRLPLLPRLISKARSYNQQALMIGANIEFMIGLMLVLQWILGFAPVVVLLLHWQFLVYRYHTSSPSRMIIDASSARIDGLLQHRFVPVIVRNAATRIRLFLSQYTGYDRQRA